MTRIRVLCVDDQSLVRNFLRITLSSDPAIEVVGTASSAFVAREMIKELDPTVLTLNVDMPIMTGIEFLERLMRLRPMPVVMFSAATEAGSAVARKALALGAVDVVAKPPPGSPEAWRAVGRELIEKVKNAAPAPVQRLAAAAPPPPRTFVQRAHPSGRIVAIGASTGGVQVLRDVLRDLPEDCPPIAIAQHMPAAFTRSFASRLDACCRITVAEAADGMALRPGTAVIGPGNKHLEVERIGRDYVCRLRPRFVRPGVAPSADLLMASVAEAAGADGVGIILTGMGKDGAIGLAELRRAGGITASQTQSSCLIYGMPRAAAEAGAALYEIDLRHLAHFIVEAPAKGRLIQPEEGSTMLSR